MAKLFANRGDPDQMPHSMASDLGLHCLLGMLLWGIQTKKWVKLTGPVYEREVAVSAKAGQFSFFPLQNK